MTSKRKYSEKVEGKAIKEEFDEVRFVSFDVKCFLTSLLKK